MVCRAGLCLPNTGNVCETFDERKMKIEQHSQNSNETLLHGKPFCILFFLTTAWEFKKSVLNLLDNYPKFACEFATEFEKVFLR